MFKWLFLIVSVFLLEGCAQTFSIEGGPKDETPPKTVKKGIQPPNESLHFNSHEINFKFDEFIQLNNPEQTLSISPNNVKIQAEAGGKTMKLKLDGNLQPKTTYVITMNGTVKDFTEGNDSLMQYVFSTGEFIDSLSYFGTVIDAKEHTPEKDIFVGLYPLGDSAFYQKPTYFSTTNDQGNFQFNYLTPGTFQLYAFQDMNRNSIWEISEKMAFIDQTVVIDTFQKDTLHLMLFQPELPQKINAFITYPCKMTVAGRNAIQLEKIALDGKEIPKEHIHWYHPDSLSFLFDSLSNKPHRLEITHSEDSLITDSLNIRPPLSSKRRPLKPTFEIFGEKATYQQNDTLIFRFSDKITSIDASKMELISLDSISLPFHASFQEETLWIRIDSAGQKPINFNLLKGGISFSHYTDSLTFTRLFKVTDLSKMGSLRINMEQLPDNAVVEMYADKKIIQTFVLSRIGKSVYLPSIEAASYLFKAYTDENNDGRWTTGDYSTLRQPEKIIRFKNEIKVRPLWDIEAELEPLKDE